MCVIMIKPSGSPFPPKEEIQNCCDANSDGFGAMWNTASHKVMVFKTMNKETFMAWYERFVKKHPISVSLVCHMRIATHGSKREENCHPWTDKQQTVGFAHNGVLQIKNRADMTDSETFFRDLWLPVYKSEGAEAADRVTEAIIGTSRFAFLHGDGLTVRWGNWEEGSVKDVYYSNSSWKKRTIPIVTRSKYYGNYGSCYDEDDVYCGGYGSYGGGYKGFDGKTWAERRKEKIQKRMDWFLEKTRWEKVEKLLARYHDRIPSIYKGKDLESMMEEVLNDKDGYFPLSYLLSPWDYSLGDIDENDRNAISALSQEFYKQFSYA